MNDLTHNKVVVVGGMEVIVRELTVAGVRNLMQSDGSESMFDMTFFDEVSLSGLKAFTSLTDEQISNAYPSALKVVIDACKEMNPDFFTWLARVLESQKAT